MLADVIAMVVDRMTIQDGLYLADVKAMLADGITTGQHYFNLGSEMFNRTHPRCVADGTCLHFYLGMDY